VAQREEDWAEKQRLLQGIVINMAPQKKKMKVSGMWKTKGTSLQSCPAQINAKCNFLVLIDAISLSGTPLLSAVSFIFLLFIIST
jgi:hypothetical protein